MAVTYEPLATTTLTATSTTITFSSISGSYTDLRLVLVLTGSGGDVFPSLRFNSDTGTNYSFTGLRGNGSETASNRYTDVTEMYLDPNYGTTTVPEYIDVNIFSYAGATNKTALINVSIDKNGSGATIRAVGLWRSTSAITSITIIPTVLSFASGTTATLYGIKSSA